MGRHLSLACDNCIPGDASGWYLPLAVLVVASFGGAALAWVLANDRAARRATALRVAGLALLAGPPVAVFWVAGDVAHGRTYCGSALSASMQRPLPGRTLDQYQEGCRATGARVVGAAAAYGAAALTVALGAGVAAAVPSRRARAAVA